MRGLTDKRAIIDFMKLLGRSARLPARVYFTGGCTAVLHGWRESTIDIDLRFVPDNDELYRALPEAKETLQVNVELASPPDFIPEVPGWEGRSIHIGREGKIDFFHFDPYSQALAKLRRGHISDLKDVASMFQDGLIQPEQLAESFDRIKPQMYRYPSIDVADFERSVIRILAEHKSDIGDV